MKISKLVCLIVGAFVLTFLTGCSNLIEELKAGKAIEHVHTYSDKWSSDTTNHWHDVTCGDTDEVKDRAEHTFGEWSTDAINHWKECSVCGKKVEEAHSFAQKGNGWQKCSVCDKTTPVSLDTLGTYTDLGSGKYTFGVFPQTIKASAVTVDKSVKNTEISGADYYLGSDGAWYAECVENGRESDSENSQNKYSDGSYVAEYNTSTPKTLYFKVEPIEWVKLSTTGCLVASKILTANVPYYESYSDHRNGKFANNYEHSQIRAYLNGISYNAADSKEEGKWKGKGFLQSAFTKEQQTKIKTTNVDNSLASSGDSSNDYTCDDTSDKVFLLSCKEAFTDNGLNDSSRIRKPTDYAFANRCYKSSGSTDGGWWFLRSPYSTFPYGALGVLTNGGDSVSSGPVSNPTGGVVPALSISE